MVARTFGIVILLLVATLAALFLGCARVQREPVVPARCSLDAASTTGSQSMRWDCADEGLVARAAVFDVRDREQ